MASITVRNKEHTFDCTKALSYFLKPLNLTNSYSHIFVTLSVVLPYYLSVEAQWCDEDCRFEDWPLLPWASIPLGSGVAKLVVVSLLVRASHDWKRCDGFALRKG